MELEPSDDDTKFEAWWDEQRFPVGTKQSDVHFAKKWAKKAWEAALAKAIDSTTGGEKHDAQ
jgi:hypothetical protein